MTSNALSTKSSAFGATGRSGNLRDVFKSLEKHKVKYVVIGGIAAVLHGVPRATFSDNKPEKKRR